jgi:hypothetical protein
MQPKYQLLCPNFLGAILPCPERYDMFSCVLDLLQLQPMLQLGPYPLRSLLRTYQEERHECKGILDEQDYTDTKMQKYLVGNPVVHNLVYQKKFVASQSFEVPSKLARSLQRLPKSMNLNSSHYDWFERIGRMTIVLDKSPPSHGVHRQF